MKTSARKQQRATGSARPPRAAVDATSTAPPRASARGPAFRQPSFRFAVAANTIAAESAFTRPDLLAVISLLVLLFGWLALSLTGERGREVRCAANLAVLGQATQDFAADHRDALPFAMAEPRQMTWDGLIAPYLPKRRVIARGLDAFFRCPSDTLPHARTRSYAMSAHDMHPENWPPGPANATGLGLMWGNESLNRLLTDAQRQAAANPDTLNWMKRSFVPQPARTVLLTELINPDNNLKGVNWAGVAGPAAQIEQLVHGRRSHGACCQYLMLDGRTEMLSPLATASGSEGGIWNIDKSRWNPI
jgi:hypothetical protein